MPKKHDITIAGTHYTGTDTLRMKGANSEEGKTIDYIAAEWDTLSFNDSTSILGTHKPGTGKDGFSQVSITSNNLVASNIKQGVTIFGVTGTYAATPNYTLQGTWRMDASKFTSHWPSTESVFEQSLTFKVKQPYSETNIEYLTYNKMSFGYVTGGALNTIKYDTTLAYASSTYSNVTTYAGWQGEHFMPGDPAQIIIEYPQSVSAAFYNWFTNVATQLEDVGTLILQNIPTTLANPIIMIPRIVNNSMVYSYYTSGYQTITDVKLNEPFFIFMGLESQPYIYQDTSGVEEISSDLNDDGYYVGKLTSVSGSVRFWYDCCFEGASKVLLPNGATKALVDINIGDTVMSYNETTGAIEENKVTALGTVELRRATQITLADDTVIRMNIYHPLYTQDGWKSITRYNGLPELTIEDKLLNSEGEYIGIKGIENVVIDEATYYTLKIEGNNNFYVNGILAQGKDKD